MKLTPDIDLMECLWHIQFQVKRSKVKVTGVIWSFCCVGSMDPFLFDRSFQVLVLFALWFRPYLTESLHMWHTYYTWEDVLHTIFRMKGQRSKVKVTRVIWSFYFVRSVASSLFDRITSYVAYIQHMRGQCVMHHFQVQRSRLHGLVKGYFLPHLVHWHICHRGNPWGDDVAYTTFKSKVKVTDCCKICHVCSIGLCLLHRFVVVFTTWLCAYLIEFWQLRCVTAIRSLDLPVLLSTRQNFHNLTCLFKSVWQRISTPSMISRLTPPNELVFSFHTGVRLKKKKKLERLQLERLRSENIPAISPVNKFKILSKLHH